MNVCLALGSPHTPRSQTVHHLPNPRAMPDTRRAFAFLWRKKVFSCGQHKLPASPHQVLHGSPLSQASDPGQDHLARGSLPSQQQPPSWLPTNPQSTQNSVEALTGWTLLYAGLSQRLGTTTALYKADKRFLSNLILCVEP